MKKLASTTRRSRPTSAGLTIIFGQGFGQAISFLRNVLLARMLLPEQFGVAVTFITVGTFFQMVADLAFDKYLIRNSESNQESVRDAVHFLNIIRGIITAAIVLAISPLISRIFSTQDYWPLYAALCLAPFFKGFEHLQYKFVQRDIRMGPEMICLIGSQISGFIATMVCVLLFDGPAAIVIGLNIQYLSFTIISHALASTPYSAKYNKAISGRVLTFGLPLVASGWLAFIGMQGDRLVVGSLIGVRELAAYATVTLILTSVNALLMAGIGSVAFPILARARSDRGTFKRVFHIYVIVSFALVCIVFVPLGVSITFLSRLLFGNGYHIAQQVACQVSIAITLAFYRSYLGTALLAMGRSRSILLISSVRALGVGLGAITVAAGYGLVTFTAMMVAAEIFSCLIAFALIKRAEMMEFDVHLRYLICTAGMLACAYICETLAPLDGPISILVAGGFGITGLALAWGIDPLVRSSIYNIKNIIRGTFRVGTA